MPDDEMVVHAVNVSSQGDGKENDWSRASVLHVWSGRAPLRPWCLEVRLNSTKKPDDLGEEHPSQRGQPGRLHGPVRT